MLTIVAVGYNRADSMHRLLNSLKNVDYKGDEVRLVVSLDNCGSDDLYNSVKDFNWQYGEYKIIHHKERLGLKAHILYCGNLTKEYGDILVLEDDLYVSSQMYGYITQCLEKYRDDENIAGIALYSNCIEQETCNLFNPIYDGNDVYFMKYPCSWGQVWTPRMWNGFFKWYENNSEPFNEDIDVPPNVLRWDKKSWLKFMVRYCAKNDKYYVFPRESLTTNFSEEGTHAKFSDNAYQVQLARGCRQYILPEFSQSKSVYDTFFENEQLYKFLGIDKDDLCVDLYCNKKNKKQKRFWLTPAGADFEIIATYALEMKPQEANIIENLGGTYFKLYDTSKPAVNKQSKRQAEDNLWSLTRYNIRCISRKQLVRYLAVVLKKQLRNKFKR